MLPKLAAVSALVFVIAVPARAQVPVPDEELDPNYLATYSIIARDSATGELGMGVQSKAFAAGNRAVHAKGGVAVIAHQAAANPMYGATGVDLLERGYSPQEALDLMVRSDEGRDRRQVAILDINGRSATWTGAATSSWAGHKCGVDYCAQGNILSGPEVVDAIAASFEASTGRLEDRLMAALDAAEAAGGDARGKQSGAILVVKPRVNDGYSDMVVDIRVDDHREPLRELRRILNLRRSGEMISEAGRLLNDGNIAAALERAEAAGELSPENDRVWTILARVHLRSGQRSAAVAALQKAVELQPRMKRSLSQDPAYEELRGDAEFVKLVSE